MLNNQYFKKLYSEFNELSKPFKYVANNNYFGLKFSEQIIDKFGKVDIVYSNNVYTHLSNFREVIKGISNINEPN